MGSRAALVVCLIAAAASGADADGARIESRKTTPQVVAESPIIATAKVLALRHKWASRRAYGQVRRYVQQYRVKIAIDGFLRGRRDFDRDSRSRVVWITGAAHGVPGKWVLIRGYYGSDRRFAGLKRGDRIILYLESATPNDGFIDANEIDPIGREPAIAKLVAAADNERRTKARARGIAAGGAAVCKAVDHYRDGDACKSAEAIRRAATCEPGHTAVGELDHTGSYAVLCLDRRGRRDGAARRFTALGILRWSGGYRRGELDGESRTYSDRGNVIDRRCYRAGDERPCPK